MVDFKFDPEEDEVEFDSTSNMRRPGKNEDALGTVDLNALQQAFDTSWGRSSTPNTAQNSVKFQLGPGNTLVASFAAIVNLNDRRAIAQEKKRYADESIRIINANITAIKNRYKNICGKTLKVKELSTSDSVELIEMNFFNPKKTAYIRRKTLFSVS